MYTSGARVMPYLCVQSNLLSVQVLILVVDCLSCSFQCLHLLGRVPAFSKCAFTVKGEDKMRVHVLSTGTSRAVQSRIANRLDEQDFLLLSLDSLQSEYSNETPAIVYDQIA